MNIKKFFRMILLNVPVTGWTKNIIIIIIHYAIDSLLRALIQNLYFNTNHGLLFIHNLNTNLFRIITKTGVIWVVLSVNIIVD